MPKSKDKNIKPEDLRRYQSGEMSNAEQHRVEKKLLNDTFLSDANEGFEAIKNDKINLESNISDLKQKLKSRTEKEIVFPPKSKYTFRTQLGIAASILIFVSAGIYFFNQNTEKNEVSLKTTPSPSLETRSDSAVFSTKNEVASNKQKVEIQVPKTIPFSPPEPTTEADKIVVENKIETESTPTANAEIAEEAVSKASSSPAPVTEKKAVLEEKAVPEKEKSVARLSSSNISGIVVDQAKKPLEGVTINLKGTSKGTKTNTEGKFYLDGLKRGDVLILNYFNQDPQEVFVRNPNIGTIVLGEESLTIPNQPKIKVEHSPIIVKDKNYTEAKPEFGQDAFNIYLKENLRKPTKASENRIAGRVTVEFKVDTTGEVSDFKIIKSLGFGCDEEAIRLIKEGQKWFPAQRYGVKEISRKRISIKF